MSLAMGDMSSPLVEISLTILRAYDLSVLGKVVPNPLESERTDGYFALMSQSFDCRTLRYGPQPKC